MFLHIAQILRLKDDSWSSQVMKIYRSYERHKPIKEHLHDEKIQLQKLNDYLHHNQNYLLNSAFTFTFVLEFCLWFL
jgi:hypothetical protein